jgi:hypothetical protein
LACTRFKLFSGGKSLAKKASKKNEPKVNSGSFLIFIYLFPLGINGELVFG